MEEREIEASILWRNIPLKGHEYCQLSSDNAGYLLTGSAVFLEADAPCWLNYQIRCDGEWQTRSASIDGWVGKKKIMIQIKADAEHHWWVNECEAKQVFGSIDIDLNFSPCTNQLPIRRLMLKVGEKAEVNAAWLRFPSFILEPLAQQYERLDEHRYRYSSNQGQFIAELMTDSLGFVCDYQGLWTVEQR